MKPWEHKWTATAQGTVDAGYGAILQRDPSAAPDVERARLASAAPEMASVLLAVEWSGKVDYVGDGGYCCCPSCGGVAPENERLHDAISDIAKGRTVIGHVPNCALDAALRKAGVR